MKHKRKNVSRFRLHEAMSTKVTLITIAIVLVILLIVWFVSSLILNWSDVSTNVNNSPDTTQKISEDLMNLPSDSELNEETDSLNQDLQEF